VNLLLKAETGFPHSDVQRMKSSETNVEACKLSKTSGVGLTPIISLDLKSEGALYPDRAEPTTLKASNSNEKCTPNGIRSNKTGLQIPVSTERELIRRLMG